MGRRHEVPAPQAPVCLRCGRRAALARADSVFDNRASAYSRRHAWVCACGAAVGCHANSFEPLGRPADARTRHVRAVGHSELDAAIAAGVFGSPRHPASRTAAYAWLKRAMGGPEPFHFGSASVDEAERACRVLRARLNEHQARKARRDEV